MKYLVIAIGMLVGLQAPAGWVSGGGELIGNSQNPWFLQNTKQVTYCVQIDEGNFGQTKAKAVQYIKMAIEYWKNEFKYASPVMYENNQVALVATQDFVLTACSPTTDISFQFGYLTSEQIGKIKDLSKVVGVSVRTEYDTVNLKGKGFVYVAPAYGPLKIQGDDILDNPWGGTEGKLFAILLHEIGHVMGLPHIKAGWIMSETFPEELVKKEMPMAKATAATQFAKMFKSRKDDQIFPHFFQFQGQDAYILFGCASQPTPIPGPKPMPGRQTPDFQQTFWGSTEFDCFSHTVQKNKIQIMGWDGTKTAVIGEVTDTTSPFTNMFDTEPVVILRLSKDQKVFTITGQYYNSDRMIAGAITREKRKGVYNSLDGKTTRKVFANIDPWGLGVVGGLYDNDIVLNIDLGL